MKITFLRQWSAKEFRAKIVVLSPSGIGKTAVTRRRCTAVFTPHALSMIGAGFSSNSVTVNDNQVHLTSWDTVKSAAPSLFWVDNGMVRVSDVGRFNAFRDIDSDFSPFTSNPDDSKTAPLPVLPLGSKNDLIDCETVEKRMQTNKMVFHYLLFAKNGESIKKAFEELQNPCSPHPRTARGAPRRST